MSRLSLADRIGTSFSRCGVCNSKNEPCNSCIKSTLRSNGLPMKYEKQLRGLSDVDLSHAWNAYSPFRVKVEELIKIEKANYAKT